MSRRVMMMILFLAFVTWENERNSIYLFIWKFYLLFFIHFFLFIYLDSLVGSFLQLHPRRVRPVNHWTRACGEPGTVGFTDGVGSSATPKWWPLPSIRSTSRKVHSIQSCARHKKKSKIEKTGRDNWSTRRKGKKTFFIARAVETGLKKRCPWRIQIVQYHRNMLSLKESCCKAMIVVRKPGSFFD